MYRNVFNISHKIVWDPYSCSGNFTRKLISDVFLSASRTTLIAAICLKLCKVVPLLVIVLIMISSLRVQSGILHKFFKERENVLSHQTLPFVAIR